MKTGKNPQGAIYVEETHHYTVELGALSYTIWEKGSGTVEVKIPYDASQFKEKDISQEKTLHVGDLQVTMPGDSVPASDIMSINVEAGDNWLPHIKSAKRAVCRANYELTHPEQTIISVQGKVLDLPPENNDRFFADLGMFQNPLQLQMDLWLPDLSEATIEDETDEISRMLLRREHTQQIFMLTGQGFSQRLTKNMVALANSYGGTIIIGVDKSGKIKGLSSNLITEMPTHLLTALFKTTPYVPLQQAALYHTKKGSVYLLKIPSNESGIMYKTNGTIYKREKLKNVLVKDSVVSDKDKTVSSPPTSRSLDDLLTTDKTGDFILENTDDVAVLDGSNGLDELNLGSYICGMINADVHEATIVIFNPSAETASLQPRRSTRKKIEVVLDWELKQISPGVPQGTVTISHLNEIVFATIVVSIGDVAAALYKKEQAFLWKNKRLESITTHTLLKRLLPGGHSYINGRSQVNLENASVTWQIRPPEKAVIENQNGVSQNDTAVYNTQHQSLTWKPITINKNEKTSGYEATLSLSLNNVALTLDEGGAVSHQSPEIKGEIDICLDDTLLSGLELAVLEQEDEENEKDEEKSYLHQLPILKRTNLHLDFTAHLSEIFKHRRPKWSFLKFSVADTILDIERARDIIQATADIGFRIYESNPGASVPELLINEIDQLENGRILISRGLFQGIRSNQFFDIYLSVSWNSQPTEITRELRYEDVHDISTSSTSNVECHIYMRGRGEGVRQEIGRLQMQLYELIKQRLQQSGAE